jgi:hypothetical protein
MSEWFEERARNSIPALAVLALLRTHGQDPGDTLEPVTVDNLVRAEGHPYLCLSLHEGRINASMRRLTPTSYFGVGTEI